MFSILRPLGLVSFIVGIAAQTLGAQANRDTTRKSVPGIQDNSFLIEEAYNQERGVVQHISGFQRDRGGAFGYQFTQEWPAPSIKHQLSYSFQLMRPDASAGFGFGDSRINYRYQLLGDGDAKVAISPRLTAVLPTGSYRRGRGDGSLGGEFMIPMSVAVTDRLVTHWDVGASVTPRARNPLGARATAGNFLAGGSAIWIARPTFNVMLEALYQSAQEVAGEDETDRSSSVTISPGIRWAYNLPSGLQIVPGIAVPLGVGPSSGERSIFLYLSFEHPFTKQAREKARNE
jgi:hypothetical protein